MDSSSGKNNSGIKQSRQGSGNKYAVDLKELLITAVERNASDLHLTPGKPPILRLYGELIPMKQPTLTPENVEELLSGILEPHHWERLRELQELDFSYSITGVSRFRGNVMNQRGSLAVAFRLVPYDPPNLDELGLPPAIRELCFLQRGLVLVTGPTGSGKSTTLAGMINLINKERNLNVVTIEDPIEFLHKHNNSIIKQREIGTDTHSFADALRHVLRHDPDVILVGEMRDLESISIALTAAETGHLVLSTLHTQNAPMAVNRIIDAFSESMRNQIRQQVSNSIQGVVAQQLLPKWNGKGRVLAAELMIANAAVRNMIRDGKEHQLYSVMQTSRQAGMQTMDQSLVDLVWNGYITKDIAIQHSIEPAEIDKLLEMKETSGFAESTVKSSRRSSKRT